MSDSINIKAGDLVIGTSDPSVPVYNSMGKKISDGVHIAGTETAVAALQQRIMKEAIQMGGTPMSKPQTADKKVKGKGRKTKASPQASSEVSNALAHVFHPIEAEALPVWENYQFVPEPPVPVVLETVVFENAFGRIKAKVESILDHPQAMLLVFSNDDELVFEPKIGETLTIYRDRIPQLVYYPGVTFDWTDGVKRAMILFKKDEENE